MPPSTTPTATLPLTPPVVVTFDMARLEAIEDATGKTCNDLLLGDFREWIRAGDQDETPEVREKGVRAISAKVARRFLAGVLGVRVEDADARIPMDEAMGCLNAAVAGFCQAVLMLNGGKEAAAAKPARDATEGVTPGPIEPAGSPA